MHLDFIVLVVLAGVGMLAGFVDAIAGGGGLICVPALLAVGMPPIAALGTNKLQGAVGTAIAVTTYWRGGLVPLRRLGLTIAAAFVASFCGVLIIKSVPTGFLAAAVPVGAVVGLVEALAAARLLPAGTAGTAAEAVFRREADNSTALLDIGAGVPHARLAGLTETVVALAVSPSGLYEPVPTAPIRIVALVLSPPDSSTDHLNTLTEIATLLRSPELRARLLAARDGGEALDALRAHAGPSY